VEHATRKTYSVLAECAMLVVDHVAESGVKENDTR